MTISLESRMCVYRALVKTMNSCTCPVVRDMLLNELFRQYRMMTEQLDPIVAAFQKARLQIYGEHFLAVKNSHFCSASDIGG